MTTITRKIEVYINEPDKEVKEEHFKKLHSWRFVCIKAANLLSTHLYTQDNIKSFIYLTEEIKVKLANSAKDPDGILTTSGQNAGYQLLSSLFKGEIPTDILSNLNANISKTYKAEKDEYFKGERSLRNYRKNIPIPFSSSNIEFKKEKEDDYNYIFSLYKIPFKTYLGRDRSHNKVIIERIISREYKLCNSSLQYDAERKKWFFLLCVTIPDTRLQPVPGMKVEAELGIEIPITARCGKFTHEIGTKEEFLYNRIRIQSKLHNLQKDLRYVRGGTGRKDKLQAVDRFQEKEKNYIATKLHTYSKILINFAVKMRAESITLVKQTEKEEQAKEDQFLLRNWSFHNLKQMIEYKAKRVGIEIISE